MQYWLIAAGAISVLTGLVHSIMGEMLIFRSLRAEGIVPKIAPPPLRAPHVRIPWATWHLASIFGFAFAAVLFRIGVNLDSGSPDQAGVLTAISASTFLAALLVLFATNGRHPGWAALLMIAIFTAIALVTGPNAPL